MNPAYLSPKEIGFDEEMNPEIMRILIEEVPWEERTETRLEAFMSAVPGIEYTYGEGRGARTYRSTSVHPFAWAMLMTFKSMPPLDPLLSNLNFNGVFLNYYRGQRDHLGWHADDSEKMDHSHPVAVASFGSAREIWWRRKEEPMEKEVQLLEPGSIFIMPAGFQQLYQHRIPKADHPAGPRISLTFRRFLP